MDYEKLIDKLRTESLYKDKATLEIMDLCMDAAEALTALLAENARLKYYENKCHDCPIVCAKTEVIKACEKVDQIKAENARLRKERDAYKETGLEPEDLKRAFNEDAVLKLAGQALGVSADRLRELAQADKENRVLPEGSGWFVTCSGKKLTVVMDIEAALRREQDG